MGLVVFELDPSNPPTFSAEERAAMDALTPEQIEENARTDPDNPPLTDDELRRMRLTRIVRRVRDARGMTQAAFAQTYRIPLDRLTKWEQGLSEPDAVALAYLETIRNEPDAVARALARLDEAA